MECREHPALADRIGLHDVEARVKDERDRPAHRLIAPYGIGRDVAGGMDLPRAHFACDRGHDLFRSTRSDDQASADGAESIVQVDKRGVQAIHAPRWTSDVPGQSRVAHEERHDLVILRERGSQSRVVVEPQVPAQPSDGCHGAERMGNLFMVCIV